MRRRLRSVALAICAVSLLASPLVVSVEAQELDKPLKSRPPVSPGVVETDLATSPSDRADAPCPCFDIQDLVVLSTHSWDLCQREDLLIQVTRWIGEEVPPEGRIGYHVLSTLPNPRSGSGTCQYFVRNGGDHETRTLMRSWPRLDESQAEICFEMATRWLESIEACPPVATEGSLEPKGSQPADGGSRP